MIRSNGFRLLLVGALLLTFVVGLSSVQAQDGAEPRTITDAVGRQVTLDAPPERVVGMSASITEMLYAIGVTPVGATEGIEYPPAAAELPTFGIGYQPNLEALAALEPDLIVANAQLNMEFMDQLEAIAPTIAVMTLTASDIPGNVRLLGQATWQDTSAEYLAQSFEHYLTLADTVGAQMDGPSVIFIVGTLSQPNFGKSETYLGDMLKRLGATNIADGGEDAGPFPGYTQLSVEAVLDADPDMIFTITRGAPGATPIPEEMAADPVWSALTAVENGQVYELDNRVFLESPGPRFTDAMLEVFNIMYGEGMQ